MSTLLIVESPTKAKTIKKFLGAEYEVLSSFGHIRDLPKKEMGVDVQNNFEPTYEIPDDKKTKVNDLKRAAKIADKIYLATDEDREGEAIAWHIGTILGMKEKDMQRIAFHEITKHAIEEALKHPRPLETHLVDAQQTRRILDRLVGYELSPFLWNKVQRGLSAGRVQSVAVRLIVDRERERQAFKQDEYWTIDGMFNKDNQTFEGKLSAVDDKKLDKLDIKTDAQANEIVSALTGKSFIVTSVEKKQTEKKPPTPFTTSLLQQEANNKYGFSAKQTMTLAQKLYETGKITYMRTDSMNLADKFLGETQTFLSSSFGPKYATGAVVYKTKSKGAQEAHEAIRPTDVTLTPDSFPVSDMGLKKLYKLIWSRSVASQMPPAKLERTGIDLQADKYTFRVNGSVITFDGFMKVYRNATETILPELKERDVVEAKSIEAKQHFTEPPARYSDATLVKSLEEYEIGRPSTYAPTINTIVTRGYVNRDDNKKLFPTDIAYVVNDVLVEHFPNIVDFEFTATMERTLDEIAEGKVEWIPTLEAFYWPFHKNLEQKTKEVTHEDVIKERELGLDPTSGLTVYVRTGRFGPYAQLGQKEDDKKPKRASLTKDMSLETVILEDVLPLFNLPRTVGALEDGTEITAQIGPYGPYLKAGKINASLPEAYNVLSINEQEAREVISSDKIRKEEMKKPLVNLGVDPESQKQILVKTGRFGPYVTDGKTNASISKKIDPVTVTLTIALEILEKKRNRKPGGFKKRKEN